MKKTNCLILTVLLILTIFPVCAAEKKEAPVKNVVSVGGQVARPGEIEYRDNTTIFSMIWAAGGPTQFGTLKRVKVVRDGKILQMDLTNDKLKNHEFVHPDDCIEVPQMNIFGR